MNKEKYKNTDEFVKMMEEFIERYRHDVKENKDDEFPIKDWKDEKFKMWHIILDAYEEGFQQADGYWTGKLFELTDAEDYFREKISKDIY
jgi:hypothetical protein